MLRSRFKEAVMPPSQSYFWATVGLILVAVAVVLVVEFTHLVLGINRWYSIWPAAGVVVVALFAALMADLRRTAPARLRELKRSRARAARR